MEIVLRHVHVRVAHDALDRCQVHPQRLHLAYVGVAAAVRRQNPDAAHLLQSLLEVAAEGLGIDDLAGFAFPEVCTRLFPQEPDAVPHVLRYRDVPIAVPGFGGADLRRTLVHVDGLPDLDERPVLGHVLRFQGQQLLGAHARAQQQPDAPADPVLREFCHEGAHFLGGEGLYGLFRPASAEYVHEGHRVLADQVVGLGLVEDLVEHAPALGQPGIGRALPLLLFEDALNVQRFDAPERPVGEMLLEDAQDVLVALLGGGRDVALVLLEPEVRLFREAPEFVSVQPGRLILLELVELGTDLLLGLPIKRTIFSLAVVPEAHHNGALPPAVVSLAKGAFPVRPSSLCQ